MQASEIGAKNLHFAAYASKLQSGRMVRIRFGADEGRRCVGRSAEPFSLR